MSRRSKSESTTNSATKDNEEEEEEEEEKKKNKPNSGVSSSLFPEIEIVAPFNDHQMVDDVDNNNNNNNNNNHNNHDDDDDDDNNHNNNNNNDDDSSVHDREMVVDEQEQASSSTAAPPLPSVAFFNHLLEEEDEETERQDDSSDPDHNDKDDDDKSRRFSAPLPQSSSWGRACDTERWTNVALQRQGQGQGQERRHGSEPLLPPSPNRQPLTHTTTYPPSSLSPPPPPTAPPRCAPPPHHHHHPSLRRANSSMAPRNVHVRRRQHWLKTLVPRPVANVVHWPSGVFGSGGGGGGGGGGPCEEKEEENQEEKNLEEQDDHDQNNNTNEHDRPGDEYDYDDENMDHKNQEEQNKERDTNQNNNTDLDIIEQQQQHVLEAAELGMMMTTTTTTTMMMMPGNDDEEEVGAPSLVKKNSIRKSSTKIADTVTPQYNLTNLRRYRQHARRRHTRRRHGRRQQQAGGGRHAWFSSWHSAEQAASHLVQDSYYYSYGAVACCGWNFNSLVVRYLLWSFRSSFGAVFLSAIVGFLALTLIFAAMLHGLAHYHPKCIGGVDYYNEPYFTDAFVLSWTTFSTVGYGVISSGTSANEPDIRNCTGITIVATLEAFVGILYAAFCSAIIFAKLSRTQSIAQVVFSTPLVIRYGSGVVIETNNLNNHHDSSTNHKNNNNNNNTKDRDDNNKEAELGAFMATATPADKNKINNNKKTSNSIFHRRRRRAGDDNETNKKKEFTKSGVADSQMTTKPCVADSQATSTSASKSARIKQVSDNSVADMRFLQDSQRLPCPILEFRIANRLCNVQGGELLDAAVNIVASIDAAQACHTIHAALQKRRRRKKRRGRAIRTSRAVTASLAVQHELEQHQKMDRDEYLSHAKELLSSSFAVSMPTTANAISQAKPPGLKRFVRWKDASTSMPRRSSAKYSDRPSSSSTFLESQSDAATTTQGGVAKIHQPFDEDPTGHLVPRRIFSKLEVETFEHPFFQHVWTVRHVLDDKSPLLRSAAREMVQANGGFWPVELNSAQGVRSAVHFDQILVSLTGTSNADANSVYAQHVYEWVDLIVGYRFAKMLYRIGGRSGSSGVGTTSRIGHRPRNKNNKSKKKSKKNDDPHEDEHDDDIHGVDDDISDFHYDDYLDDDDDEDEPQWRVDLELLNDVTEQAGEDPGEPFPGAVKDTLGDHLANMLIL